MAQAGWASITCQPQQTTFATEWQALTYSGSSQADLQFLVEVVLFGGEVEAGHGLWLLFRAVLLEQLDYPPPLGAPNHEVGGQCPERNREQV